MSRVTAPTKPPAPELPLPAPPETPPVPKFRRVRSETLDLPRGKALEAARSHIELPRSPTERLLDPKRLKELVERIRGGTWLPACWATVSYEGTKYRMNGQHSSQAMLDAADLLPEQVALHLDHYEAEDREQMAMLFRQFDARFSGRSKQDVAGAYQGLVHELDKVPREKAKLGIEGATWYERVIEGVATGDGDTVYGAFFLTKYHSFLLWLDKVLTPWQKVRELRRPAIVGAMYHTFITSESGAQDFWPHIARPDLPDDSDPRSVLSVELNAINEQKGKLKWKPAEFYAKCIKAWNAFRAGSKISSLKIDIKKGLPEIAA